MTYAGSRRPKEGVGEETRRERWGRGQGEKRRDSCSANEPTIHPRPGSAPPRASVNVPRVLVRERGRCSRWNLSPRPRFRPRMTTDKFSRLLSFWPGLLCRARSLPVVRARRPPSPRPSPFSLSRRSLAILCSKQRHAGGFRDGFSPSFKYLSSEKPTHIMSRGILMCLV